jgi:hypothetical protein
MKVPTGFLMLVVATGVLCAQSAPSAAPAKTNAAPQTKPATAAKASAKPAKKKPAAAAAAAAPAQNAEAPAAKDDSATTHLSSSKRDPFISPIQTHSNEPINCGSGKRCLVPGDTVLQGIVKGPNGMIAVVSNTSQKAYFLRENDPVYNGFVVRITPDSVVFREQVTDKLGKKSTREVVKKVTAPAV